MKSIRVLTCALVASTVAASAASIEQVLDITVNGWYQGPPISSATSVHDRVIPIQLGSDQIVRALAVDKSTDDPKNTNFYTGTLIYKTALDGSTTNVVIRQRGKTNELDVTDAFAFSSDVFVVDQVIRTNVTPPVTNSYVERGLKGLSFTTTTYSFTNIVSVTNAGFSLGTSTLSRKLAANVGGTVQTGYCFLLNYSAGSGTFVLNTNKFATSNFQFTTSGPLVSGPAQISFKTFAPAISPN